MAFHLRMHVHVQSLKYMWLKHYLKYDSHLLKFMNLFLLYMFASREKLFIS